MAFNFKPMMNKIPAAPAMAKLTVQPSKAPAVAKFSVQPENKDMLVKAGTRERKAWGGSNNEGSPIKSAIKQYARKR